MLKKKTLILLIGLSGYLGLSYGQSADSLAAYAKKVQQQTARVDEALTQKSAQYLEKLSGIEAKLMKRLQKLDPSASARLPAGKYEQYLQQWKSAGSTITQQPGSSSYNANLDTMKTTLNFLRNPQAATASLGAVSQQLSGQQLTNSLGEVQQLEGRLAQSAQLQQYVQARSQQLSQLLQQYTHLPSGLTQSLDQYKETGYYYKQQVQSYKDMLNDPEKVEAKVLAVLRSMPVFQQFMSRNSELAALFPMPQGYGTLSVLNGLQSRSQVQQVLQQAASAGGTNGQQYIQQQVDQAQGTLDRLKSNVTKYGQSGADLDMPQFQPNTQKTKTFLHRLEYGANIQFARSTTYFPATGNLGLSIGYKVNDKSTIGVGASYTMGMGSGWGHIRFSNQSLGLRSFMDWKIKGTWYVTGGYEENYLTQFKDFTQLRNSSAWQESALIGTEKKYRINSKLQGNLQFLYDALYRQQVPQGQMIKFRVGYNFN